MHDTFFQWLVVYAKPYVEMYKRTHVSIYSALRTTCLCRSGTDRQREKERGGGTCRHACMQAHAHVCTLMTHACRNAQCPQRETQRHRRERDRGRQSESGSQRPRCSGEYLDPDLCLESTTSRRHPIEASTAWTPSAQQLQNARHLRQTWVQAADPEVSTTQTIKPPILLAILQSASQSLLQELAPRKWQDNPHSMLKTPQNVKPLLHAVNPAGMEQEWNVNILQAVLWCTGSQRV
jgi:hypothetical protein